MDEDAYCPAKISALKNSNLGQNPSLSRSIQPYKFRSYGPHSIWHLRIVHSYRVTSSRGLVGWGWVGWGGSITCGIRYLKAYHLKSKFHISSHLIKKKEEIPITPQPDLLNKDWENPNPFHLPHEKSAPTIPTIGVHLITYSHALVTQR